MKLHLPLALALVFSCATQGAFASPERIKTVLMLKQRGAVTSLLQKMSDPTSSHFGKPYTPAEIAQEIGLSDPDYAQLVARLGARGFRVVHEDATRGYLIVESDRASLEKTFRVELRFDSKGHHFASAKPTIPRDLSSVQSLVNLDNRVSFRPRLSAAAAPADGPQSGLGADDIAKMYGFDVIHQQGFSGKNQKIATVAFDVVNPANVATYFSAFNITPAPTIQVVSVTSTAARSVCTNQLECDNEIEDDVDLQMAGRVAPAATLMSFVGTTDDYLASWVSIFTSILDRGDIFVVNNSDDSGVDPAGSNAQGCEALVAKSDWVAKVDPLFQRAAAQGVSIFSASGDNGSDNCGDGSQGLDWPTSPYIVSVGGTDLDGSTEIGWSGSGGGFSVLYPRPSWQTATPSSATMRGTPDVALYAGNAPGQAIFSVPFTVTSQGSWLAVGGTSLSAPTMAGFIALVNEARQAKGKKTLPLLTPILYAMSAQDRANCFNDIVGGSNGNYTAAAGWDAVTGLGSPRGAALFQYLVNY